MSGKGEQVINNVKKLSKSIAFLLLALAALLAMPVLAGGVIASEEARLTELTANTDIAENLASETSRIRRETDELRLALAAYESAPMEKDRLLNELAALSGTRNVELVMFSEISAPAAPADEDPDGEADPPAPAPDALPAPEAVVKTYGVTLNGGSTDLYETLRAVEALNGANRITDASWVSDYVAGALPRVPDNSSLLDSLANESFLETYRLRETEYSDAAALSFTIEYFYWVDHSGDGGGGGA